MVNTPYRCKAADCGVLHCTFGIRPTGAVWRFIRWNGGEGPERSHKGQARRACASGSRTQGGGGEAAQTSGRRSRQRQDEACRGISPGAPDDRSASKVHRLLYPAELDAYVPACVRQRRVQGIKPVCSHGELMKGGIDYPV